ncbi:MAG: hypothetical protein R6U32_00340 [Candidatus Woesearchaeota archaeon]
MNRRKKKGKWKRGRDDRENMNRKSGPALSSRGPREREYILYLMLIVFLMLMLPHLIRFFNGNTALIGGQAYYHSRAAEAIIEGDTGTDSMVYGGREFVIVPYHYALAFAGMLLGVGIASKILPFVFGVVGMVLFYNILRELGIRHAGRFVTTMLLIVSPPFIYLFSVSTPDCLSVLLTLAGISLFLRRNRTAFGLSLLCFAVLAFTSIFNMLFAALALAFLSIICPHRRQRAFSAVVVMLALYAIHPSPFYPNFEVTSMSVFRSFVSDLGAEAGFSIFSMILAVVGLFHSWRKKSRYYPLYMGLALLLTSSVFIGWESNLYTNFLVVVFAALGLDKLRMMEWTFIPVRNITLVVLVCGLLFSTVSYMDRMPMMMPGDDIVEGLQKLREDSGPEDIVFSHYSRGYWIQYMAERPVLLDSLSVSSLGSEERYSDSLRILHSVDLDETAGLIRKYNISRIWIDRGMREELVWERDNQGLLFLLRNNKTFKKVQSNSRTDIIRIEGVY